MTVFAMLFPGQGSQYIGMLSSFFKKNIYIFKQTFDEASEYLNFNLLQLTQEGPTKILNNSQYTQAVILTASVSIYRFWININGKSPLLMAGHSLGEYSALVCSHSINFLDALKIVSLRGKLMHKISINHPYLMKAIIGIDKKIVKDICLKVSKDKIVSLASINSNEQVVISGDQSAVHKASLKCKQAGAKHIFNLNINIPTHSNLMIPISIKLKKILKVIKIKPPRVPVVNNFNVKTEYISKNIKRALIKQLYNTVRWEEIIKFIQLKKIFTMLEIDPGKVLTNINKNNNEIISLATNNLNNFSEAFKKIHEKKNEN